ncbi:uncharacterized protein LOC116338182 [Contarinia nasturtii]|uniref:uncharacterized protein LOC116338182 n=1 Tax=Contarinia nasturtii TaxID=265458 RepID=UPI0012D45864|nr:uncharacterized protein LOC116338182 [Contarinia nasturtii]
MTTTTNSVQSSFSAGFKWIHCNMCLAPFSEEKKFILTSCDDMVICLKCANQLRSTENPRKIQCLQCKRVVSAVPINENMPQDKRDLFINPDILFDELDKACADYEIQDREQVAELKRMDDEVENYKRELAKWEGQIMHYEKLLEEEKSTYKEGEYEYYRDLMLNVMSEDGIETLVAMDTKELKQMNAAQMSEASRRPRPAQTVSSTPYNADATGLNVLDSTVEHSVNMNVGAVALGQQRRSSLSGRKAIKRPQETSGRRTANDRRPSREMVDGLTRHNSREHTRRKSNETSTRRNSNDRRRPSRDMVDGLTRRNSREHTRRKSNETSVRRNSNGRRRPSRELLDDLTRRS